jgi:hypothetical protein
LSAWSDAPKAEKNTPIQNAWRLKRYEHSSQEAECIAVVPAGEYPFQSIKAQLGPEFRYHQMDGKPRDHESYFVALPMPERGRTRKVYFPRVKDLKI